MNRLKTIAMASLVCITTVGNSICAYAGGVQSSVNNIEKSLLNNPVDAEWVRQAEQIKSDLYTHPYRYFDCGELKILIKKTEDAMTNYNNDCDYNYQTLVKIRDAFNNARTVQMREY